MFAFYDEVALYPSIPMWRHFLCNFLIGLFIADARISYSFFDAYAQLLLGYISIDYATIRAEVINIYFIFFFIWATNEYIDSGEAPQTKHAICPRNLGGLPYSWQKKNKIYARMCNRSTMTIHAIHTWFTYILFVYYIYIVCIELSAPYTQQQQQQQQSLI